jgi:hypothetical protein
VKARRRRARGGGREERSLARRHGVHQGAADHDPAHQPHLPIPPERTYSLPSSRHTRSCLRLLPLLCLRLLLTLILVEQKARIQIWLFEQKDMRIEGRIIVSTRALAVSGFILFFAGI